MGVRSGFDTNRTPQSTTATDPMGFDSSTHRFPQATAGEERNPNESLEGRHMEHLEVNTAPAIETIVSAATAFIRAGGPDGDGCIVTVWDLFEELRNQFGEHFRLSPEQEKLLELLDAVVAKRDVELISSDGIEFGWAGGHTIARSND
jgi:hypothetical protein